MTGWSNDRIEVGDGIGFDHWRMESPARGPRVVVLGGVHGDETEGILAAGQLSSLPLRLLRGILDIVPVCHEVAFEADSRTSPLDGLNLARVFPGHVEGRPTERIAAALTARILRGCDLLIDLHTSGQSYDMPFLAGFRRDAESDPDGIGEMAAREIGADFLWFHGEGPSSRSVGRTLSVVDAGIYLESPGGGPTDSLQVDRYVDGVLRVLARLDMFDPDGLGRDITSTKRPPIEVAGGGDLDRDMIAVNADGYFIHAVGRGDRVVEGQELGHVRGIQGELLETLSAPRTGYVMAVKRRSRVHAGDLVVNLAVPL